MRGFFTRCNKASLGALFATRMVYDGFNKADLYSWINEFVILSSEVRSIEVRSNIIPIDRFLHIHTYILHVCMTYYRPFLVLDYIFVSPPVTFNFWCNKTQTPFLMTYIHTTQTPPTNTKILNQNYTELCTHTPNRFQWDWEARPNLAKNISQQFRWLVPDSYDLWHWRRSAFANIAAPGVWSSEAVWMGDMYSSGHKSSWEISPMQHRESGREMGFETMQFFKRGRIIGWWKRIFLGIAWIIIDIGVLCWFIMM